MPPAILVVPSNDAFALPEALGAPLAFSGGQIERQPPVQAGFPGLSPESRYSVWPELVTRIVPSEAFFVVTTVAALEWADWPKAEPVSVTAPRATATSTILCIFIVFSKDRCLIV
jgi:hypothetical protein